MQRRVLAMVQTCYTAVVLALLAAAPGVHADEAAELAQGKQVFAEMANPKCALCHVLKDAGATGEIGPSLDELRPDTEQVIAVLRTGAGVMPSYADKLTDAQIEALARYVAHASRK